MNVESTLNKFMNPVEKHGQLLGAGYALYANTLISSWHPLLDSIQKLAAGNIHAPEWQNILNAFVQDTDTRNALLMTIVGYLGKEAIDGSSPMLEKIFNILYKVASGFLIANTASIGLYFSTHSDSLFQNMGIGQQPASINPTAGSLYTKAAGQRPIGIQW